MGQHATRGITKTQLYALNGRSQEDTGAILIEFTTAVAADGSNLLVFYPSNNPNVEKGIDLANSSLKEPWNGNWSCKGNGSTLAINLLPSECR